MRFTQPEKLEAEQTDGDDEEILVFTQPVVAHPSKLFMCWPKGGHQVELKPCSECLVGSLRQASYWQQQGTPAPDLGINVGFCLKSVSSRHAIIRRGSTDEVEVEHITQAPTVFTEVERVNGDITPVPFKSSVALNIGDAVVVSGVAVVGQARQRFRFELVDALQLELQKQQQQQELQEQQQQQQQQQQGDWQWQQQWQRRQQQQQQRDEEQREQERRERRYARFGTSSSDNSTSGNCNNTDSSNSNSTSGGRNGRGRGNKSAQNKRKRDRENAKKAATRAYTDGVTLGLQQLPARERKIAERALQLAARVTEGVQMAISSGGGAVQAGRDMAKALKEGEKSWCNLRKEANHHRAQDRNKQQRKRKHDGGEDNNRRRWGKRRNTGGGSSGGSGKGRGKGRGRGKGKSKGRGQ